MEDMKLNLSVSDIIAIIDYLALLLDCQSSNCAPALIDSEHVRKLIDKLNSISL